MRTLILVILSAGLYLTACTSITMGEPRMNKVDVRSFGAVPGDGRDDAAAVLAALEECRKLESPVLVFSKGRYHFSAGNKSQHERMMFVVSGIDNLTIDGQGSEFAMDGLTGVFAFSNCKNLTLRNFSIDWDRPFFSTGKVVAAEGNHFDVEVLPEYPVKGGEPVEAYMDYDPVTKLPMRGGVDQYYTGEKTELLREQVLRVYVKNQTPIKPGVLVVLRHSVYGTAALHCDRCSDVKINDVTVHHVPGMGFTANVCTSVTLSRFHVVPSRGRIMSATADATHFGGCKGTIRMDSCEFEGMGDDGVNIKSGLYLSLVSKIDERTIVAVHNLKFRDAPDPGDSMEISHVDDLLPYATARVESAAELLDKTYKLQFDDALPSELKEGDVFGNSTRCAKVRISNCQVRKNRARGMLIQTRDAVIENCKFIDCTSSGIMVLTEVTHFFESIGTRDVTVRNCLFDHCNYGAALGPGALCAYAYLKGLTYPPKPGVHKNIVFEGNTIRRTDGAGIFVAGVDGMAILNNSIQGCSDRPSSDAGHSGVYVMSSKGVHIEGNKIDPKKQGTGFEKAIAFGEGVVR